MDRRAIELLEHGLKDIYDAEQKFAKSLVRMASNADDGNLADGFERHRVVTEKQVKRIEEAFECLGSPPERENCAAANGLVTEYEKFVEEHRGGNGLLDAYAANAGLKVEHYEIASYRGLVDLAEYCGQGDVAQLLKQNLMEEEQAAAELTAASNTLSARLAGAPARKVATRAVGTAFDQAREGTMATVGATVGAGRAVAGAIGSAIERAERRGRQSRTGSKRKTSTAKRKVSGAKRKVSGAKRKTSGAKRKAPSARSKAKKATARKTSTARKAAKRPARKAKRTTRKPAARRRTAKR